MGETVSIQAPTYFELNSLDTGKVMDYIHSTTTNLVLGRYVGKTVLLSGEEELDERWPNTPVLTIQRIQLVNDAPRPTSLMAGPSRAKSLRKPRDGPGR